MTRQRARGFSSFAAGYGLGRQMVTDYRDEVKRRDMAEVAEAKPEESQGYTADDGAQLEAAAKSGQYDIGVQTNEDGTFKAYSVTPKSDPTQTGVIAQKGVTDFLGQRTEGQLSQGQQDSARTRAMGGVLRKNGDPMGAMRLEREAKAGEREDQRFSWEQGRVKREEDAAGREDTWRTGREQLFQQSGIGQVQRENSEAKRTHEAAMAEYQKRVAAGEQGLAPPPPPQLKDYGVGQALLDNLSLAAHDVEFGKASPESLAKLAKARQDLESEGYAKALRLAQGGAPVQRVLETYNAGGKDKLRPEDVVSDQMVDRGNGVKSRVLVLKGPGGKPVTIDTFNELDALGKADSLVDRVFKVNAEGRAQGADTRAKETHSATMQDRKDKRVAGTALFQERNPNATPAELDAVRAGVIPVSPANKDYKLEMNEVATAFGVPAVDGQGKPIMDLMTGRQVVNRDTATEDKFFAWMKKNGITDTNKGLLEFKALTSQGKTEAPTFASEADAEAAVKAGKLKKGDRVTIGGKTGTWQ